jgi:hypothetical protein
LVTASPSLTSTFTTVPDSAPSPSFGNLKSINPQYSKADGRIYKTGRFAEARECRKAALERKQRDASN